MVSSNPVNGYQPSEETEQDVGGLQKFDKPLLQLPPNGFVSAVGIVNQTIPITWFYNHLQKRQYVLSKKFIQNIFAAYTLTFLLAR